MREWLIPFGLGFLIALVLLAWILRLDLMLNKSASPSACDPQTLWCGAPPK